MIAFDVAPMRASLMVHNLIGPVRGTVQTPSMTNLPREVRIRHWHFRIPRIFPCHEEVSLIRMTLDGHKAEISAVTVTGSQHEDCEIK